MVNKRTNQINMPRLDAYESEAIKPANWNNIAAGCAHLGEVGHFAPVAFASVDQPFLTSEEAPVPLWRGHGVHVRYQGLEPGGSI